MKRSLCLLLILALLFSGCSFGRERLKDPVTFYYLRSYSNSADYDEFFSEGAIGSEEREASGHRQDLNYLLTMYLQGPLDSELDSPFPSGCKSVEIRLDGRELTVSLNTVASQLDDMDLTIACACLAKTCMALADVDAVHIESRDLNDTVLFTRSFTGDSLLWEDTYTQPQEATDAN